MKIAYFTDTYFPQLNGVSISIANTAEELRKRGHIVYIFAPKIPRYKDEDPYITRLNSFKVLSSEPEVMVPLPLPNKSYGKIMSLPFDLVHGHGNGAFSLLGYQVARMRGVPYIMTFHTLHTKYTHYILKGRVVTPKMVAAALRIFGNRCNGVIAPSEKMKGELIKYGVKKPIKVIPSIVDVTRFGESGRGFLRKRLKIPSHDQVLLSVGRLGKEKNFHFLIKAFSKIHKKFPSAHLIIIGQGPEEKNLVKAASNLKLSKNVHLTHKIAQAEMPRAYADADIFLFASKTETQGLAVVEAAASGLPLVVVDDEAFDQIATPKNAFILPLSQKDFVKSTLTLLNNAELRKIMGKESHEIARQVYDAEQVTGDIISYYGKILENFPKSETGLRNFPKATLKILANASYAVERFFK